MEQYQVSTLHLQRQGKHALYEGKEKVNANICDIRFMRVLFYIIEMKGKTLTTQNYLTTYSFARK